MQTFHIKCNSHFKSERRRWRFLLNLIASCSQQEGELNSYRYHTDISMVPVINKQVGPKIAWPYSHLLNHLKNKYVQNNTISCCQWMWLGFVWMWLSGFSTTFPPKLFIHQSYMEKLFSNMLIWQVQLGHLVLWWSGRIRWLCRSGSRKAVWEWPLTPPGEWSSPGGEPSGTCAEDWQCYVDIPRSVRYHHESQQQGHFLQQRRHSIGH